MTKSYYDSPHGLMNKNNLSSAEDQAILISECMKIDAFRKVVGTKVYETKAYVSTGSNGLTNYKWENTNKLLNKHFISAKTGITPSAGPCLVSHFKCGPYEA